MTTKSLVQHFTKSITEMAGKLHQTAIDSAALKSDDVVIDAYSELER